MRNVDINRRTALIATASLLFPRHVNATDAESALFWTVTSPGHRPAVLFGYVPIAASLVPDIVKDGETLVAASQRVVIDMPRGIRALPPDLLRDAKPVLQVVSPQTADRLRGFLAATPASSMVESLGSLPVMMLLMSEGRQGSGTLGGAILDYARSLGRPVDELLSAAESAWRAPDMTTLNSEDAISYLLNLRDRLGPIGGYLERLYRQRKGEEMVRMMADMNHHGAFSLSQLLQNDRTRGILSERALNMLTQQADEECFMLLPLDMVAGPSGLLAALKMNGVVVAPRA